MDPASGETSLDARIRDLERAVALAPLDAVAALRLAQALQRTSRREDAYGAWLHVRSAASSSFDTATLARARKFLADNSTWSQWRGGPRRDGCSPNPGIRPESKLRWSIGTGEPPADEAASLCITPWTLILATATREASRVLALDPDSGKQIWSATRQGHHSIGLAINPDLGLLTAWLASRPPNIRLERRDPTSGHVIGTVDQPLASVNSVHGSTASGLAPIAMTEDHVFVLVSGQIIAFDPATLHARWTQSAGDSSSVCVQDDVVAVLGERGYRRLFDVTTGHSIPHDQLRLPGASDLVRRCRSRGFSVISVPGRQAELQCVDLSNGRRVSSWSSSAPNGDADILTVGCSNQVALIQGKRVCLLSVPALKAVGELRLDDARAHDAAYLHDRLYILDVKGSVHAFG